MSLDSRTDEFNASDRKHELFRASRNSSTNPSRNSGVQNRYNYASMLNNKHLWHHVIVVIVCRLLLAYVMIPTVQREVDTCMQIIWNTHRIREQKETFLPDGVLNHISSFPEKYGLEECGRQTFFHFLVVSASICIYFMWYQHQINKRFCHTLLPWLL